MHLVTWNRQDCATADADPGWREIRGFFRRGAQVVCLQHCGPLPAEARPAAPPPLLGGGAALADLGGSFAVWEVGTRRAPRQALVYHVATDADSARGLAVAVLHAPPSDDVPHAPSHLLHVPNPHEHGRPAIGLRLPVGGFDFDVYTLAALGPQGPDTPALLAAIGARSVRWFVAGGFARDPAAWTDLPRDIAVCPHNAAALHPGTATVCDYALLRPGPALPGRALTHLTVAGRHPIVYAL